MKFSHSLVFAATLSLGWTACSSDDSPSDTSKDEKDDSGSGGSGTGSSAGNDSGGSDSGGSGSGGSNSGGASMGGDGMGGEGMGGEGNPGPTPTATIVNYFSTYVSSGETSSVQCGTTEGNKNITYSATVTTGTVDPEGSPGSYYIRDMVDFGEQTVTCIATHKNGNVGTASHTFFVLPAGRVGHWPLNGDANSVVGSSLIDGAFDAGEVIPTTDRNGDANGAMAFNETGVITVGDHPDLDMTGAFTVSAFIKTAPSAYERPWFSKFENAAYNFIFEIEGDDHPTDAGRLRYLQSSYNLYLGPNIADSEFHHVVVVINPGSPAVAYIDGVSYSAGAALDPAVANDGPLLIGGKTTGIFNGMLDEVMLFNRALTADEVAVLSNF